MPRDTEIFFELGLATRMRRLADTMCADIDRLYEEEGLIFRARYFYVMYILVNHGDMTIADIAKLSGFSHSAVSQTISKLVRFGIVETHATEDGRQKLVRLTPEGHALKEKILPIWQVAGQALKKATTEGPVNILEGLASLEDALDRKSAYARFQEEMKDPTPTYTIEPYHIRYKQAFYDLNAAWLKEFFVIEPIDEKVLSQPEETILAKGGELYFAVAQGKPIGVVAMKSEGNGIYELTKLGVAKSTRKGGIGAALCKKVIERFEARGGTLLYLDTNTVLDNAIRLYKRLGFIEKKRPVKSVYERSDYYMEWPSRK